MEEQVFERVLFEEQPESPGPGHTGTLTVGPEGAVYRRRRAEGIRLDPVLRVRFDRVQDRLGRRRYQWLRVDFGDPSAPRRAYLADPMQANWVDTTSGEKRIFKALYRLAFFDLLARHAKEWSPEESIEIVRMDLEKEHIVEEDPWVLIPAGGQSYAPSPPVRLWSTCPDCGGEVRHVDGAAECSLCRKLWSDPGRLPALDQTGKLTGTTSDGSAGVARWAQGSRSFLYLQLPRRTPPPLPGEGTSEGVRTPLAWEPPRSFPDALRRLLGLPDVVGGRLR